MLGCVFYGWMFYFVYHCLVIPINPLGCKAPTEECENAHSFFLKTF